MKTLIKIVLILGVLFLISKRYNFRKSNIPTRASSQKITIYELPNTNQKTQIVRKALDLRGLSHTTEELDLKNIKNHPLYQQMKEKNLIKGNQVWAFVNYKGKLVDYNNIHRTLAHIPIHDASNLNKNTLLVYGPKDCMFTKHKIRELKKAGFEYQYRDVNSLRYRTEFQAKIKSTGRKTWKWPIVDVKGVYLSNPSIKRVKQNF